VKLKVIAAIIFLVSMGVKFGADEVDSSVPNFSPRWCGVSPLWEEKPLKIDPNNLNTAACALCNTASKNEVVNGRCLANVLQVSSPKSSRHTDIIQ